MKKLGLDESALYSQENLSKGFKLDKKAIMKMNIKIIDRKTFLSARKDETFSNCPGSTMCIFKPIFSTDFKTAILPTGLAFTCSSTIFIRYSLKNGKWFEDEINEK